MIKKTQEKSKVIEMRKQGRTYSDILKAVPVAKSTLAIWLKEAKLSKSQKQKFSTAKRLASLRGGEAKREQRVNIQNSILFNAKSEILYISKRELFLIGTVLYWAEGSKEKIERPGSQLAFSNMDPKMIQIFLTWLFRVCKIKKNMIIFNIFLHQTHRGRVGKVKRYWSRITGFPIKSFTTIYWKRNKIKTNRKNTEEKYYGLLKIKVKTSSGLVRKIAGWTEGIFEKVINK
jgi:hypothetical protein